MIYVDRFGTATRYTAQPVMVYRTDGAHHALRIASHACDACLVIGRKLGSDPVRCYHVVVRGDAM